MLRIQGLVVLGQQRGHGSSFRFLQSQNVRIRRRPTTNGQQRYAFTTSLTTDLRRTATVRNEAAASGGTTSSHLQKRRYKSTAPIHDFGAADAAVRDEMRRLHHLRNVGVFAHVDAGKTTVTERMLALCGYVPRAGNVDDGNTVTDYLPAERERGITIQSAAIRFPWAWHNAPVGDDYEANDEVTIALIDTPGHVDFSVEVNRSVAVLDGAVLVVDAVAGVQAQTETVWRALTHAHPTAHPNSSILEEDEEWSAGLNFKDGQSTPFDLEGAAPHEPLPCIAVVNKMDKVGHNFALACKSLRNKLPGANPIPLQIPLFRCKPTIDENNPLKDLVALLEGSSSAKGGSARENLSAATGDFVGVVDLLHMRAIIWPDVVAQAVGNVEACAPKVIPLLDGQYQPRRPDCSVTQVAQEARLDMIASLAEVDAEIEEFYLNEQVPSNAELRQAFRRATLAHQALPVLAAAALRGKGIEPVLDAIADLLPSPLDRQPPALTYWKPKKGASSELEIVRGHQDEVSLGHSLHPSALAFAFKVLHMKGKGGSGEGRVVFARVYSGSLKDRDTIHVVSPPALGELPAKPRVERIGGMLEMAGGKFGKLPDGLCQSGEVCALVGLKSVVTGDTLVLAPEKGSSKKKKMEHVFLAGVQAPRPVLTVRLETETIGDQTRLSEALKLLSVEDPSIVVEETESATLLSGLGELHVEIVLDRLNREFGIPVIVGAPSVAYRESLERTIDTNGLFNYDRTIGDTRFEASVHLVIEPVHSLLSDSMAMVLQDPKVTIEPAAREYLGLHPDAAEEDLVVKSAIAKALVQGCIGALKRGPLGPYSMANVLCRVIDVDAEEGVAGLEALPGALRAAAANAVSSLLHSNKNYCTILEPTMNIEVTLPNDMVGSVLSDLTGRRGNVGDVYVGDSEGVVQAKALVRGEVPLIEILGYANSLRSLTAGEASFTAEYKGHAPCKS